MTGHVRADARKRDDETAIPSAATIAGRRALRDAATALAEYPTAAGYRVWLDAFAGTWEA